ncbi:LOW QUALITY PROTEIN: hypothetical protein IFM46972_10346 [Aspergillus udagawae]|uniref:Uncharacterized protein n=1 Tax=Aspergillus udagawae TaxID=91492 RepID=A0A8H3XPB6_9EURO|nr:LOW QUALITY PROTEIN: hypothetical protein IFM46972_10346 [Aspergillus udagawae]
MHRDHAVCIPVLRAPAVAGMMAPGEERRARQRAEAVAVIHRAQELEGAEVHPSGPGASGAGGTDVDLDEEGVGLGGRVARGAACGLAYAVASSCRRGDPAQ